MSSVVPNTNAQLIEQQILLTQQQMKNTQELHCLHILGKLKMSMQHSDSEDEKDLFHNLRASVFLELKGIRDDPSDVDTVQQQMKNTQELHCLHILGKLKMSMQHSDSEDEKDLFHNLRASVFLELKGIRDVHE